MLIWNDYKYKWQYVYIKWDMYHILSTDLSSPEIKISILIKILYLFESITLLSIQTITKYSKYKYFSNKY